MPKIIAVLSLCVLFALTSLSLANVAEDGLVAYWPFDEGKGKEAIDVTGNGHDGEFNDDPKWVEGNSVLPSNLMVRTTMLSSQTIPPSQ